MRMLQFGDSMLPIGSFAFSNALESAVQSGVVSDVATLRDYVHAATRQAARSDGIAVLHAFRAAVANDRAGLIAADRAVQQRKLNEEARSMSAKMGLKLAEVTHVVLETVLTEEWLAAIRSRKTPGTYPASLGVAFAELAAPEEEAFAVHQYGTAFMMLSAALRIMRIDHMDVQRILFEVNGQAPDEYLSIANAGLADMAVFAPMIDVLSAVHVRSHVRLFMS
jgi:urease accessory protein